LQELNARLDELSKSFAEYRRRAIVQTISAGGLGVVAGVLIGLFIQ